LNHIPLPNIPVVFLGLYKKEKKNVSFQFFATRV
jgi:hypothetical protein